MDHQRAHLSTGRQLQQGDGRDDCGAPGTAGAGAGGLSAAALYTPDILGLAVKLASYPLDANLPLRGEAHSRACGSRIEMALEEQAGTVRSVGMMVQACAVGQAAAAVFAEDAIGRPREAIRLAERHLSAWLAGGSSAPDWAGIEILTEARQHPGRHGAILLPWKAALAALPLSKPAS